MLSFFIRSTKIPPPGWNKERMVMGKKLWLKIIVVIIIQALLLTQADFALAAMYQSKDTFKEAVLRFNRIATKSVSLIDGIGSFQLSLVGLHLPHLNLDAMFSLLEGSDYSISKIVSVKELRVFNNEIYKALSCSFFNINNVKLAYSLNKDKASTKEIMARSRNEVSTGPPTKTAKLRDFIINRIV